MTHPHEGLQERALREALKKCRQQFEYYVQQHMAKTSPDMDKAATNQEFVELCEFALSSTPPVPQDQGLRDALEPFAAIKMGDDADCRVEIVPNGYSDPSDWRRHIKRAREALSPPQQAATDEGVGQ